VGSAPPVETAPVGVVSISFCTAGSYRIRYQVVDFPGDMPGVLLQERLEAARKASGTAPVSADLLRIAAADLNRDGLPDISDPDAQRFYEPLIADADLVVVDNLSTLCRSLKENEADSWAPVQAWCLALRRQGKSVLLIHHGGKSGAQRGTSRKEDVLDTVIALKKPPDYRQDEGAPLPEEMLAGCARRGRA
jgi:putative DNA primase/helicase